MIKWPFARKDDDEKVRIDGDEGHEWWAERELETTIDRRWRQNPPQGHPRRRASDRSGHSAHGDASDADEAANRWDPSALFTDTASVQAEEDAAREQDSEILTSREAGSPWSALGLRSDASWGEVVRRHRQLAKQHHPDRADPDDPDARRRAEQQMTVINSAFHDLRRIYRLTDSR